MAPVCRHGTATFAVARAVDPGATSQPTSWVCPGIDKLLIVDEGATERGTETRPGVQRVAPGSASEILIQARVGPEGHPDPEITRIRPQQCARLDRTHHCCYKKFINVARNNAG